MFTWINGSKFGSALIKETIFHNKTVTATDSLFKKIVNLF